MKKKKRKKKKKKRGKGKGPLPDILVPTSLMESMPDISLMISGSMVRVYVFAEYNLFLKWCRKNVSKFCVGG